MARAKGKGARAKADQVLAQSVGRAVAHALANAAPAPSNPGPLPGSYIQAAAVSPIDLRRKQSKAKRARQRRQRKEKRQSGSNLMSAQAASGYLLSPMSPHGIPVPSMMSDGLSTFLRTIYRDDFNTSTTHNQLFFISSVGHTSSIGYHVAYLAAGGPGLATLTALNDTRVDKSPAAGGPSAGRPMRAGVTITNLTKVLDVSGTVYFQNMHQRAVFPGAPSGMTDTEWRDWGDGFLKSPSSQIYSAQQTMQGLHGFACPIDQPAYTHFDGWTQLPVDSWFQYIATWLSGGFSKWLPRAMSTLVIMIPATTSVNSYNVVATSDVMVRYPLDTVMASTMRHHPTDSADNVNRRRDHAEVVSSTLKTAGEVTGAAAAAAAAVYKLVAPGAGLAGAAAEEAGIDILPMAAGLAEGAVLAL